MPRKPKTPFVKRILSRRDRIQPGALDDLLQELAEERDLLVVIFDSLSEGILVTDTEGRTTIANLYACGEVACTGVHGANRLASNSLLEAVVFARRAAISAKERIASIQLAQIAEYPTEMHSRTVSRDAIAELVLKLQTVMWKYVGIVRTNERLSKALDLLSEIEASAGELWEGGKLTPELLELRNMVLVAKLIVLSALSRKESRGLHYNLDYPDTDDARFRHDTLLAPNSRMAPELVAGGRDVT